MTTAPVSPSRPALRAVRAEAARLPELEGQRGLAALAVVVFHAYRYGRSGPAARYPAEGAWYHPLLLGLDGAVDWFFVLSAFLLTLPYARALHAGQPLTSARTFLGQQAARIVPLYVIAVLVVWVSRNPTLPGDWRDLLLHLTFTQVYDQRRIFFTIGPAWSLAVEVQFYVLLALLGVLLARTAPRATTSAGRLAPLVGATGLLATASTAWWLVMGVLQDRPAGQFHVWFSLLPKLSVFAIGMAAAVLVVVRTQQLTRTAARLLRRVGIGAAVGLALLLEEERGSGTRDWLFHTASSLTFALVVVASALAPQHGVWHRLTARGALPFVGLVSYSLYLWHEPLLLHLAADGLVPAPGSTSGFWLTAAVLCGLGVGVAWVSYRIVERPFSTLRVLAEPPASRTLEDTRRQAP